MDDMEDKTLDMDHDMRRATCCMKTEMKKMKTEAYECLASKREKVKHEFHIRKMQKSIAEKLRSVPRDLMMCPCIDCQE